MSGANESSRFTRFAQAAVICCVTALLISIAVAAVAGVGFLVVFDPFEEFWSRLLGNVMIAVAFSGLSLLAALVMRHSSGRMALVLTPLMLLAMVLSCVVLIGWTYLIWGTLSATDEKRIAQVFGTVTVFNLVLVQASVFAWLRTRSIMLMVAKSFVSATTAVMGIIFIAAIWGYEDAIEAMLGGMIERALLVGGAVAVIGTLVVPSAILIHSRRGTGVGVTVSQRIEVSLACPICNDEMRLKTGPGKCRSCGTLLTIDLEEPRCECGYLLYQLRGTSCPECGRDVPVEKRGAVVNHGGAERGDR